MEVVHTYNQKMITTHLCQEETCLYPILIKLHADFYRMGCSWINPEFSMGIHRKAANLVYFRLANYQTLRKCDTLDRYLPLTYHYRSWRSMQSMHKPGCNKTYQQLVKMGWQLPRSSAFGSGIEALFKGGSTKSPLPTFAKLIAPPHSGSNLGHVTRTL